MKKEKTLGIAALILSALAVIGFILSVWLFAGKEASVIVNTVACVLIMLAAIALYVISVMRDREDDFGCVFFPFFLAALASAVMFASAPSKTADVASAIALGSMAAFLAACILQIFGKRLVIIPILVGAAVLALSLFGMNAFSTFFVMILGAAALLLGIIFFKKNDGMAFWSIIAGVVVFGFLLAEKIWPALADYSPVLNMLFMATLLCGLSAIPEEKKAPARELTAPEPEEAPADRSAEEKKEESAPAEEAPLAPYAKWVLKRFQNLSAKELMDAPVFALKGVSEEDAKLLQEAFGVKTIGDFANNKFFNIADRIFEDSLEK